MLELNKAIDAFEQAVNDNSSIVNSSKITEILESIFMFSKLNFPKELTERQKRLINQALSAKNLFDDIEKLEKSPKDIQRADLAFQITRLYHSIAETTSKDPLLLILLTKEQKEIVETAKTMETLNHH